MLIDDDEARCKLWCVYVKERLRTFDAQSINRSNIFKLWNWEKLINNTSSIRFSCHKMWQFDRIKLINITINIHYFCGSTEIFRWLIFIRILALWWCVFMIANWERNLCMVRFTNRTELISWAMYVIRGIVRTHAYGVQNPLNRFTINWARWKYYSSVRLVH